MAYTFFKAQGLPVGKSLVEDDLVETAKELLDRARAQRHRARAAGRSRRRARSSKPTSPAADARRRRRGDRRSHGPRHRAEDRRHVRDIIQRAKTVVWNGPMGVFEMAPFAAGTIGVAQRRRGRARHDHHRRRRFRRGRDAGRRRGSDDAHLDGRRRVARVPRRPDAARRRRAANAEATTPRADRAHAGLRGELEDAQDGARVASPSCASSERSPRSFERAEIIVAPPFTALAAAAEAARNTRDRHRRAGRVLRARGRVHRRSQRRR